MRLRIAFKINGDEAELARQLEDAAGISIDKIAKVAFQKYMQDVIARAEAMQQQAERNKDGLQPSHPDPVHSPGIVQTSSDPVPSETP